MRLVIQGSKVMLAHLQHIHGLLGVNTQFNQIGEYAYYLPVQTQAVDSVKIFLRRSKNRLRASARCAAFKSFWFVRHGHGFDLDCD